MAEPVTIMRDTGTHEIGDLVTTYAGAPGTGHTTYRVTGKEQGTVTRYENDRPITEPCVWLVGTIIEDTVRELTPWEVI